MTYVNHRNNKKVRQREIQGAAMMAVMLILLLATATAAVTVESTGFEARASGYNRIAVQVKNISESSLVSTVDAVQRVGVDSFRMAMQTDYDNKLYDFNTNGKAVDEPPLQTGAYGYRVKYSNYVSNTSPLTTEASIGPNQAYTVGFSVDIVDTYISTRPVPGYSTVAKSGSPQFINMTYIARGQMVIPNSDANTTSKKIEHVSCACVETGPLFF
jgi:hypothetical protein